MDVSLGSSGTISSGCMTRAFIKLPLNVAPGEILTATETHRIAYCISQMQVIFSA